jgi:tetratricopeptide (TPR) repeat protein
MTDSVLDSLSDADRALASSSLLTVRPSIPMPRLDQVQENFEQRLRLAKNNPFYSRLGLANTLIALGDIAQEKGQYDVAHEHFGEALGLFRTQGMKLLEESCLDRLAELARKQGDFANKQGDRNEAEKFYTEALKFYREMENLSSGDQVDPGGTDSIDRKPSGRRENT